MGLQIIVYAQQMKYAMRLIFMSERFERTQNEVILRLKWRDLFIEAITCRGSCLFIIKRG